MRALLGRRFGRDAPRRQSETCATANHSLPSRALKATLLASAVFLSLVTAARAEIFYVYDDLSRLIAVVDEQGNAATYTYDAVGNILRIDRFDAAQQPGPVRITLVTPTAGKAGTQVQIFGTGFSPTPTQNTVAFTGATAPATAAAPDRHLAPAPTGAGAGAVTGTGPPGGGASPAGFRGLGGPPLTPSTAACFVKRT